MECVAVTEALTPSTAVEEAAQEPKKRNKGGRPKGSTNAKQRADVINVKEARNWVVGEYAVAK